MSGLSIPFTASSVPASSFPNERTPCLCRRVEDDRVAEENETTLRKENATIADGNHRNKSKLLVRALAATAILVILLFASNNGISSTTTTTPNVSGKGFVATRETQPQTSEESSLSFDDFLVRFDKSYESKDEYDYRKGVYETNQKRIRAHNANAGQHGWKMGINKFADLLPNEIHKGLDKNGLSTVTGQTNDNNNNNNNEEHTQNHLLFADLLNTNDQSDQHQNLRHVAITKEQEEQQQRNLLLKDLPESVDWRTHYPPVVTPIKDQGHCGSCWAFAATAVLESHAALSSNHGELVSLSPQELVSCAPNPNHCGGDGGCSGSTGELAYDYVSKHGMVSEWEYGYTSYHGITGTCGLQEIQQQQQQRGMLVGARVGLVGYSSLPTNSYEALIHAVATMGPVVVSVAASGWGLYKGGVFDDFDSVENYDINHAVVLEGYGTDAETNQDYWLVRNSWGVKWGESGYIRLKRRSKQAHEENNNNNNNNKNGEDGVRVRCKKDITPSHGVACEGPHKNATIPDQLVCGTSGILYANVVPVGAYLIENRLE